MNARMKTTIFHRPQLLHLLNTGITSLLYYCR